MSGRLHQCQHGLPAERCPDCRRSVSDKQKRHPQTLTSADIGRRARVSSVYVGEIIAVEHQLDDDGRITTRITLREGFQLGEADTVEVW